MKASRLPGGMLLAAVCLTSCTVLLLRAGEASAQERVDSTRIRFQERLQRLGRAPGYDSILFVQDSVAEAARAGLGVVGAPALDPSDTTLASLLGMPGYALTEYEAGEASFGARDRMLVLKAAEGARARVSRDGVDVRADTSIVFSEASGLVRTAGSSTFTPTQGDAVESAQLLYDVEAGRGSAFGAETAFTQAGSRWFTTGDMPFASPDSTFMSHARFTSCTLEVPHYHFETDELKIVPGNILVAWPARLYFADVPVMWLPFIVQSLSQGRSSGLLTPRFSVNDIVRNSTGYRRRLEDLGFYWAMSDYSDAELALDWFSDNYMALRGAFNYRFNRRFLQGGVNLKRYWQTEGGKELTLNTNHSWEIDERTQLSADGSFATSPEFITLNSFDQRELTRTIDSQGSLSRRFSWGALSLGASRQQSLSDEKVVWWLPRANLSLSPITLLRAPPGSARFWNNVTWSGGVRANRNTTDRVQRDTFSVARLDEEVLDGGFTSTLSFGNLSFTQGASVRDDITRGVPEAYLVFGDAALPANLLPEAPARSITNRNVDWSASVSYQQRLIGSTTLTPNLNLSGAMFQSDTSALASSLVSEPSRISFGATLRTDVYGFFPGFGGYGAIRHKLSPAFSYSWSPEVSPDELQRVVFGSRVQHPIKKGSVTLNQTFEAKRTATAADSAAAGSAPAAPTESGAPTRRAQADVVSLLALRTSVVQYDFVRADSAGDFLRGFETTRLSNQIQSDFLGGLSVGMEHDLFQDTALPGGGQHRRFAPHLAGVNFSFSLSSRTAVFRWLGLAGQTDTTAAPDPELEPDTAELGLAALGGADESPIIPTGRSTARRDPFAGATQEGGWRANLSYSLRRPRATPAGTNPETESQMVTGTFSVRPTPAWDLTWQTGYDLTDGAFSDHVIRLTRDLHEWQAHFDFTQTSTGNWRFSFEVELTDLRDLKFDYRQTNLDVGRPAQAR